MEMKYLRLDSNGSILLNPLSVLPYLYYNGNILTFLGREYPCYLNPIGNRNSGGLGSSSNSKTRDSKPLDVGAIPTLPA